MRIKHLFLVSLMFILPAFACTGSGTQVPPDDTVLMTAVSETLTAVASTTTGDESPETSVPPAATNTPAPTAPLAPSPTSLSPPVLRIVYTNGGNIWLIEGVNPPVQLTSSSGAGQVLISSDGMKVAYIRRASLDAQAEIHSINIDGSGDSTLLTPAQFDALYPLGSFIHNDLSSISFVPGTHYLMLNTRAISEGPGLFKHDAILLLDADTAVLTTPFPPDFGGDFALSPDGNQVAVLLPTSISLANINGTNRHSDLVTYDPVITYSEFQYYAQPVWSTDSSQLGVAIPSSDPMVPAASGTIWRIPADGSAPQILGTITGGFYFPQVFGAPVVSPNLLRVAFLRDTGTLNVRDLYLANVDGSGQTAYANGGIQWHGWAPDSTHFVYSLGGPMDLHLGVDGGSPTAIGSCNRLRWIDNTEHLCLSGIKGSWTIVKGQIGGGLSPIVSPAGDFVSYDFDK